MKKYSTKQKIGITMSILPIVIICTFITYQTKLWWISFVIIGLSILGTLYVYYMRKFLETPPK